MKKLLPVSVLAMFVSQADAFLVDFYVGGTIGMGENIAMLPSSMDLGDIRQGSRSYGAVAGIDIPFLRFEGEYNFIAADNANLQAAMANVYFKFSTPIITPYIGGGVGRVFGASMGDVEIPILGAATIAGQGAMAYQGMLGLTVDLPFLPVKIDLEGRVFFTPDAFVATMPVTSELQNVGFLQYDVRAKLRYVF